MRRRRSILVGADNPVRINVTPMIDVVMVLIVFFLIVGKLAADRRQVVLLPRSASGQDMAQRGAIELSAEYDQQSGGLYLRLGGAPVPLAELSRRLEELAGERPRVPLRLRADRRLTFEQVRPLLTAAREAGIARIQLVAERAL